MLRAPAYRLDIVAVGIKNKRSVVVFGVLRTQPGLPVTDSPGSKGGPIERIDGMARLRQKRHMQAASWALRTTNPEHRIWKRTETYYLAPVWMLMAFH